MINLYSHKTATDFSHLSLEILDPLKTVGNVLDYFRAHSLSSKSVLDSPGFGIRFVYHASDTEVSMRYCHHIIRIYVGDLTICL